MSQSSQSYLQDQLAHLRRVAERLRPPEVKLWVVDRQGEVVTVTTRCAFCKEDVPQWAAVLHPISCDQRPTHLKANWRATYNARMDHHSWGWKKEQFRQWWHDTYGLAWQCAYPGCAHPRPQVHHITYIHLGDELMTDLLPLCGPHHNALHARSR
jgi:hypothetical protein